jgi:uncharacterized protein YjfI (DUF2170 family)
MQWTTNKIDQALEQSCFYTEHNITKTQVDAGVVMTFHDYGDLPVVLAAGEQQILVEVALVERDEFNEPEKIDYQLLNTHKYLPLSTIAIEKIDGQDWYVLFGSLSTQSKIEVIAEELVALVGNTFSVIDALEPLYKFNTVSKQEAL